ncbi:hypothetical protein [Burkholderia sp. USMB20]|uniref:hypothetical protein n=1 Tax=Burkholderia sp. USMB20 TaxID=1571773 RepID=UPI000698B1B3|nr:hypothetical protein [Burkholderia sp. USMB20]TGN96128.1 hypothetical protein PL79_018980 [Burkholderia sp. USMB20]
MANLQKVNLGTAPTGVGGDSYRGSNVKANANVDVLNAQAALITGGAIYTPRAILPTEVGRRWGVSLAADGTINLPAAKSCPVDSVIMFRNASATTKVTLAVGAGSGDMFPATILYPGELLTVDTDGVNAWRVLMRGRSYLPDETVRGMLTTGGITTTGVAMFMGAAGNAAASTMGAGVVLGANTGGDVVFKSPTAAADCGMWDIQSNDTAFSFRTIADGWKSGNPWMVAYRGGGSLVDAISIGPNSGTRTLIGTVSDDKTSIVQIGGATRFAGSATFTGTANTFTNDVTCTRTGGGFSADDSTGANHSNFYLKRQGNPMWGVRSAAAAGDEFQINAYDPTSGTVQAFVRGNRTTRTMTVSNRLLVGGGGDDSSNALQVNGSAKVTSSLNITNANSGIEIGSLSTTGTPFIDFHTTGQNIDYDARIIAQNGTTTGGTTGTATLTYVAGQHQFQIPGLGSRLTVNNRGAVLMGTTDDGTSTLQVAGPVAITGAVRLGRFGKAGLPSAAAAENKYASIIVMDATGGPKLCVSDGTNWCVANTTTVVS